MLNAHHPKNIKCTFKISCLYTRTSLLTKAAMALVSKNGQLNIYLGLFHSRFCSSALDLSSQTPPTRTTLLREKCEVKGQLHVFFELFKGYPRNWSFQLSSGVRVKLPTALITQVAYHFVLLCFPSVSLRHPSFLPATTKAPPLPCPSAATCVILAGGRLGLSPSEEISRTEGFGDSLHRWILFFRSQRLQLWLSRRTGETAAQRRTCDAVATPIAGRAWYVVAAYGPSASLRGGSIELKQGRKAAATTRRDCIRDGVYCPSACCVIVSLYWPASRDKCIKKNSQLLWANSWQIYLICSRAEWSRHGCQRQSDACTWWSLILWCIICWKWPGI